MFRGEKNTNWEGGYRVPTMIRWPGVIKPGTVVNDIGGGYMMDDYVMVRSLTAGAPLQVGPP
jgi:arylsulfatase